MHYLPLRFQIRTYNPAANSWGVTGKKLNVCSPLYHIASITITKWPPKFWVPSYSDLFLVAVQSSAQNLTNASKFQKLIICKGKLTAKIIRCLAKIRQGTLNTTFFEIMVMDIDETNFLSGNQMNLWIFVKWRRKPTPPLCEIGLKI